MREPDEPIDRDLRVAGHDDAGHLGRRIGMRDRCRRPCRGCGSGSAPHASTAALQQRMRSRKPRVVLDVAPAHHGAEPHAVGGDPDLAQFVQLAQIDQQLRRGEAERQHRHQALPAGDHLGLAVVRGEQLDGFGERGRTGIIERRQFHGAFSARYLRCDQIVVVSTANIWLTARGSTLRPFSRLRSAATPAAATAAVRAARRRATTAHSRPRWRSRRRPG